MATDAEREDDYRIAALEEHIDPADLVDTEGVTALAVELLIDTFGEVLSAPGMSLTMALEVAERTLAYLDDLARAMAADLG